MRSRPNTAAATACLLLSAATVALLVGASSSRAQSSPAPDFALPKRDSTEQVRLADFAGEIVVLDFFAYWCGPCRKASAEIEGGIQKFYATKQGNPQGVPVRVLAINIERDNPKLTAKFIKDAGLELVVNDFDAKLLEQFKVAGTPFIVVIDGTHATKEKADFRVLYQNEGFAGTKKLREVIDGIKPPPKPSAKSGRAANGVIEAATGLPVIHQGDLSFEAMLASDIQLTSTALTYGQKHGATEWKIDYTHNTIGEDYEPYGLFDFLGYSERINANYNGGAAYVRQELGRSLTWRLAGGGYDGFADYRSLWLANYYKQQFSFVPGYETPHPSGYNVSTSLRWEYQPATGFAELWFLYAHDTIAPGYEFEPLLGELLQAPDQLDTYSPALKFENIFTRRIRWLNEFQLVLTTGREPRYAYRSSVNVALGERWVWRTSGGYTFENPALRAWYAGATLEFEITPRWLVNLSGLYYHDTGEIENSAFISTAAPGLQTWQVGLGLRYVGDVSSFSVSVAPIIADYQPVEVGTRPFTNLYQDRNWLSVQAAWTVVF